jgi:hypothetical protein
MPANPAIACSTFVLILMLAGAALDRAGAETYFAARYTISLARIPIGTTSLDVELAGDTYAASASGEAGGLLGIVATGKGRAATHGAVVDGALRPARFSSDLSRDGDTAALTVTIERGAVTEVAGAEREPDGGRVPLASAHLRDIVDPLTALLIPSAGGAATGREACARTLPVFDGHRRYDLELGFKRFDKLSVGGTGPLSVAVCTLTFRPLAGHRADSKLVRFLAPGRNIELWLAPVTGTGLLAPVRLTISHLLGNLVVQASEFRAAPAPALRAAVEPAPPGLTRNP